MSWGQVMRWVLFSAIYPFMVVLSVALLPAIGFLFARDVVNSLTHGDL